MNQEQSTIKRNVMRRVYFIHTARKFTEPRIIKLGLLVVFFALESWFVSIPHVVANLGNAARSTDALYSFVTSAFMQTQTTVQLLSLGIAVVGVMFVLDFIRKSEVSRQLSWNA